MAIDWKIKAQKELRSSGPTPIADKMVVQRQREMIEMLRESQTKGYEIAKVFMFRPDDSIEQTVVEILAEETGKAHSVTNPLENDEVIQKANSQNFTSGTILHTHPTYVPRPSYNDIQAGMKSLMLIPSFMIIGEVVTDLPPDIDSVLTSTLDKSIAVWGMETGDSEPLTKNEMSEIFTVAKHRVESQIDEMAALQDSWQLTGPFIEEVQRLGINTKYQILGRKKDLYDEVRL
jgi:proteasome lid subunit RPN8/RPN11